MRLKHFQRSSSIMAFLYRRDLILLPDTAVLSACAANGQMLTHIWKSDRLIEMMEVPTTGTVHVLQI